MRTAVQQLARQTHRPLFYLQGSAQRKELLAPELARRDGLTRGLIGIWSVVEPCLTYFVRRDREHKKLVLRLGPGKCLHYYFYFLHVQLGLSHLRLQAWFPFALHLCVNGRHWLARQLDQAGIGYIQRDNCFTWIEDLARAQDFAFLFFLALCPGAPEFWYRYQHDAPTPPTEAHSLPGRAAPGLGTVARSGRVFVLRARISAAVVFTVCCPDWGR